MGSAGRGTERIGEKTANNDSTLPYGRPGPSVTVIAGSRHAAAVVLDGPA